MFFKKQQLLLENIAYFFSIFSNSKSSDTVRKYGSGLTVGGISYSAHRYDYQSLVRGKNLCILLSSHDSINMTLSLTERVYGIDYWVAS